MEREIKLRKPRAYLSSIKFSGGEDFELKGTDKIIIVGANNSGKSQTLREILNRCRNAKERGLVVTGLVIDKIGAFDELKAFLMENADYVNGHYRYKGWQVNELHLAYWSQANLQGSLLGGFVTNITADERLRICLQQSSVAQGDQKTKPQHILYDDEALMGKISGLFRNAFGKDLIIDYRGGSKIPIHVGEVSKADGVVDRVSDEYVRLVRQNPLLDKQGDGMKSYAGILFEAVVGNLDITLIDEPEAFLHPPQMRRLGETLSSEVNGQLIVSTHSSDILRGFLEGTRGGVRILRINRDGDVNHVSEASAEVIKELWMKPELRYSNALEGIFHEQTIICEDDSDCRLINSVADHLAANSGEQWKDTAYVPAGGKHGIPKIAEILHKIGVPTKAVFDIDFLSERSLVESTVKAFGGDWEDYRNLWSRVDAAVRNGAAPKSVPQIKQEIIDLINASEGDQLPRGDIVEAMKQGKPWSLVKRFGVRAIPPGEAQRDFDSLRDKLEALGIYLVHEGEVENFCREIGLHGPKFVTRLLSVVPLDDAKLSELRSFVRLVHQGRAN